MDANELRALADALDDCDPPYYESSPQINRSLDACIAKAADYLRAQADAQPVAEVQSAGAILFEPLPLGTKLYTHPAPAVPAGWKLVPVEPTPEMLDEGCDVDARAEVIKKYAAMPVIRNPENCCSCGEVLAVQYRAMLAAAPAAPQAEPKREPLSDERIDTALQTEPVLITRLMIGSMTVGEFKAALRRVARTIERAHGIGGSDE